MQIAALRHAKMAVEFVAFWVAVSFATEFTLGHLPNETFWVEVVDELIAKF
jgi:hypothetical protein